MGWSLLLKRCQTGRGIDLLTDEASQRDGWGAALGGRWEGTGALLVEDRQHQPVGHGRSCVQVADTCHSGSAVQLCFL